MQQLNKIVLVIVLITLFINQVYGYINISEAVGIEKISQMINYWILLMPIFFIYFILKKYKYAYLSLFFLSIYLIYKVIGFHSFTILFTMFFYKHFYLQLYIYYLSSWLIPLFSLIGVIIQLVEYKNLKGGSN